MAIFSGASMRRHLESSFSRAGGSLRYEFFESVADRVPAPGEFDAALVELGPSLPRSSVGRLRRALRGAPLGSLSRRTDDAAARRSLRLGFDFHLDASRAGRPTSRELRARLRSIPARREAAGRGPSDLSRTLRDTSRRLAILTDVVKTANSILEPGKVMELIMGRVQQLIASEAWSILLVDENKQELRFELALGDSGASLSRQRIRLGEGVAGWVAQTGQATIVNDVAHDPRFSGRLDVEARFQTRSILCAPLVSRGRTIGVVEVINRKGRGFTRRDLELLMSLVEPCAIAIENAMLFKKAEELTITDDLTKLFNARYLNLYVGREVKRCKRSGTALSLVFLDLDAFKSVNDHYGHLAGSRTLFEVGEILRESVRGSDVLARYGGDEFVAVLPETAVAGAVAIAERIRRAIEGHSFLQGQGLRARITASLGIATFPDHALTPEGLIQKADQAMYRAKLRTKNDVEVAV